MKRALSLLLVLAMLLSMMTCMVVVNAEDPTPESVEVAIEGLDAEEVSVAAKTRVAGGNGGYPAGYWYTITLKAVKNGYKVSTGSDFAVQVKNAAHESYVTLNADASSNACTFTPADGTNPAKITFFVVTDWAPTDVNIAGVTTATVEYDITYNRGAHSQNANKVYKTITDNANVSGYSGTRFTVEATTVAVNDWDAKWVASGYVFTGWYAYYAADMVQDGAIADKYTPAENAKPIAIKAEKLSEGDDSYLLNPDVDIRILDLNFDFGKLTEAGIVLVAQYAKLYTVNYDGNKGEATVAVEGTMPAQTDLVLYGKGTALTANTYALKAYEFKGWATEANGAKVFEDGAVLTEANVGIFTDAATTLYAVWEKVPQNLTYANLDNIEVTAKADTYLTDATLDYPTATAKVGYKLNGWTFSNTAHPSGFTTTETEDKTGVVTNGWYGDVTVTANVTEIEYTYTYNFGDHDENYPAGDITTEFATTQGFVGEAWYAWYKAGNYSIATNPTITLANAPQPAAGYTFDHWQVDLLLDNDVVVKLGEYKPGESFTAADVLACEGANGELHNIRITAVATPNEYTITYSSENYSDVKYNTGFNTSEEDNVVFPISAKAGKRFIGWKVQSGTDFWADKAGYILTSLNGGIDTAKAPVTFAPTEVYGNLTLAIDEDCWEQNATYTITLVNTQGTENTTVFSGTLTNPGPVTYKYGDASIADFTGYTTIPAYWVLDGWFIEPTVKEREGIDQTNNGWCGLYEGDYISNDDLKALLAAPTGLWGDVTLTANYTNSHEYTVKLHGVEAVFDGKELGFGGIVDGETLTEALGEKLNVTTTGKDFLGWYKDEACTVPVDGTYVFNAQKDIDSNAVFHLYAKWSQAEYSIIFAADDNYKAAKPADLSYNYGQEESETLPAPEGKEGYVFAGWAVAKNTPASSNNECNWAETVEAGELSVAELYGNVTLTPIWQYVVTFNAAANGGKCEPASVTVDKDDDLSDDLKDASKDYYDFFGWYKADGTEWDTETDKVTAPITLTAVFTPHIYTVDFTNGNTNGTIETKDASGIYTVEETVITLPTTSPDKNYEFAGWDLNGDGKAEISVEDAATGSFDLTGYHENLTIVALWNKYKTYTVSFDLNNGAGDTSTVFAPQEVYYLETAKEPASDPTRNGYEFNGWWYNGEEYDFDTEVTKDITLTADWKHIKYSLTVDINKDLGATYTNEYISDKYYYTDDTDPIALPVITAPADYYLAGWTVTLDGDGYWGTEINGLDASAKTVSVKGKYGNVTLKAYYAPIGKSVLHYDVNTTDAVTGCPNDSEYTPNATATVDTDNLSRAGQKFLGWSKDPNATVATYAVGTNATVKMAGANTKVTLYAVWEKTEIYLAGALTMPAAYYLTNPDTVAKVNGTTLAYGQKTVTISLLDSTFALPDAKTVYVEWGKEENAAASTFSYAVAADGKTATVTLNDSFWTTYGSQLEAVVIGGALQLGSNVTYELTNLTASNTGNFVVGKNYETTLSVKSGVTGYAVPLTVTVSYNTASETNVTLSNDLYVYEDGKLTVDASVFATTANDGLAATKLIIEAAADTIPSSKALAVQVDLDGAYVVSGAAYAKITADYTIKFAAVTGKTLPENIEVQLVNTKGTAVLEDEDLDYTYDDSTGKLTIDEDDLDDMYDEDSKGIIKITVSTEAEGLVNLVIDKSSKTSKLTKTSISFEDAMELIDDYADDGATSATITLLGNITTKSQIKIPEGFKLTIKGNYTITSTFTASKKTTSSDLALKAKSSIDAAVVLDEDAELDLGDGVTIFYQTGMAVYSEDEEADVTAEYGATLEVLNSKGDSIGTYLVASAAEAIELADELLSAKNTKADTVEITVNENETLKDNISKKVDEDYSLVLAEGVTLIAGKDLGKYVETNASGKDVTVTEKDGKYTYAVTEPKVEVVEKEETPVVAPVVETNNVTVTVTTSAGGTATPSSTEIEKGSKVSIAVTPNSGYSIGTVKINGTTFQSGVVENGILSWTVSKDTSIVISFVQANFSDVPSTAWYAPYVSDVVAQGLMVGYSDGTFGATKNMTIAEYLTVMYRYLKDMVPTAVATKDTTGANWSAAAEYVNEQVFGGAYKNLSAQITRYDVAHITSVVLQTVSQLTGKSYANRAALSFSDVSATDAYYSDVTYLSTVNIIDGYLVGSTRTFQGANNITRAEIAKVLSCLIALG